MDFMLKISNDVDKIKKAIDNTRYVNLINPQDGQKILDHMPVDMKFGQYNAIEVLNGQIKRINELETKTIREIDESISNLLSFAIIDPDLNSFYSTWTKFGYMDKSHVARVESNYGRMKVKFESWQDTFNKNIKNANKLRGELKTSFNAKLEQIKAANAANPRALYETLDKILDKLNKMEGSLNTAAKVLRQYNDARVEWAEYIMGKVDTLTDALLLTNR